MLDGLSTYFTEQGLLGVIVFLLLGALVYLFRLLQAQHETMLEDRTEVVKALIETANSNTSVASSVEKTNEILRALVSKQGAI